MFKKSIIGLVVIGLIGGGYYGYSQYQAKVEADKRKVVEDIKRSVIKDREKKLKAWEEGRVEREREAAFAKEHYPKVLNGTGTIEPQEFIDDKEGVKRAEYQLVDGNIGGKYTLWYENGIKQEEGFLLEAKGYENFRFTKPLYYGEKSEFTKKGVLEKIDFYDNYGKKISYQMFYSNGIKKYLYVDNKVGSGGESISWYQNGQMMEKYKSNGMGRHGWAEYWYPNGVKKCEGEFDSSGLWRNDLIGVWEKWDEDGNLVAEGYFSDNKMDKTKPHVGTETEIKECSIK